MAVGRGLRRFLTRRRDLAAQFAEIRRVHYAAAMVEEEMNRRRDGFLPDRRYDVPIAMLLDLADELSRRGGSGR